MKPKPLPKSRKASRSAGIFLSALVLLVQFTGCATSTSKVQVDAPEPGITHPAPAMIYVSDFYLDPSQIGKHTILREDGLVGRRLTRLRHDDPAEKARALITILSETIVEELKKAGQPAEYRPNRDGLRAEFYPADARLPETGWLVGGWFATVDEGNRAVEATAGFGTGQEHVEIQVVAYNLAGDRSRPFLHIGTESGKQMAPGGLVTMNPYAMAAKFVLSKGTTEKDVRLQGKAIASSLIRYIRGGDKSRK